MYIILDITDIGQKIYATKSKPNIQTNNQFTAHINTNTNDMV